MERVKLNSQRGTKTRTLILQYVLAWVELMLICALGRSVSKFFYSFCCLSDQAIRQELHRFLLNMSRSCKNRLAKGISTIFSLYPCQGIWSYQYPCTCIVWITELSSLLWSCLWAELCQEWASRCCHFVIALGIFTYSFRPWPCSMPNSGDVILRTMCNGNFHWFHLIVIWKELACFLKHRFMLESATVVFLKVEGERQDCLVLQLKVKTVSKNS